MKGAMAAAFAALVFTGGAYASEQETEASETPPIFEWEDMEFLPFDTGGGRRNVFDAPTSILDGLEIHITTMPPGGSPHPPHTHDYEEIIVVKEGMIRAHLDGVEKVIGPGSLFIAKSGVPHTVTNVGETDATYHVISWVRPADAE